MYATAVVPIFDHVSFALARRVPVSNCFNGLLRALTKNSLEDRMSKFHLVKKWWDFENRDFGVQRAFSCCCSCCFPDTVMEVRKFSSSASKTLFQTYYSFFLDQLCVFFRSVTCFLDQFRVFFRLVSRFFRTFARFFQIGYSLYT